MNTLKLDRDAARTEALKREKEQDEKDERFIDIHNRAQQILSNRKQH